MNEINKFRGEMIRERARAYVICIIWHIALTRAHKRQKLGYA